MIQYVKGDILLTRAAACAHGVAPNDPMNQGLALSLRERYPSMHKDFHHWCGLKHPHPGEAWIWTSADNFRIINLLTQSGGYDHGSQPGKAALKHVSDALRAMTKIIAEERIPSLALPRLATGVGGLDWSEVRHVLESRLNELTIPVFVYSEFHAGMQADEALGKSLAR